MTTGSPFLACLDNAAEEKRIADAAAQDGTVHAENNYTEESSNNALILTTISEQYPPCLLYTSPSPRDQRGSRMPSSA